MSQLVLIDQSLKGVGGHHFEYAYHILREAEQRGRSIVLATHRDFSQRDSLPATWQVLPLFEHDTYSPHSVYFRHPYKPGKSARNNTRTGLLHNIKQWWTARQQQSQRAAFAKSCGKLFLQAPLSADDEVFVPTLSELDLAGLVDFLNQSPQPSQVNWRLQFHFDVCDGRPHEFASQAPRGQSMQESIAGSLQRSAGARFFFYNTTTELTGQYNALQTASFETLHYPVNPKFAPRELNDNNTSNRRLRVTCGGYFRREKGRRRFAGLIADLAPDLLSHNSIQLSAQCKQRQMNKILRDAPAAKAVPADGVVCAPHPLGVDEYVDYIKQSDIGLFLYDGRRYFSRCSGVLVEMLAAGVPVITPNACWLEEQYTDANQQYLQQVANDTDAISITTADATIGPTEQQLVESVRLKNSADALLTLQWADVAADAAETKFARLICRQLDAAGTVIDEYHLVMRSDRERTAALAPVDDRCCTLQVAAASAYCDDRADVSLELRQLPAPADLKHRAMGAVGLAFDREEDIGRLIRDIVRHHQHYQNNARQHAGLWRKKHSPAAVLNYFARPEDQLRAA